MSQKDKSRTTCVISLVLALAIITQWHPAHARDSEGATKRPIIAIESVAVAHGLDRRWAYCRDRYPGFALHTELELLVASGLTPADALRAATIGPAEFLGLSARAVQSLWASAPILSCSMRPAFANQ